MVYEYEIACKLCGLCVKEKFILAFLMPRSSPLSDLIASVLLSFLTCLLSISQCNSSRGVLMQLLVNQLQRVNLPVYTECVCMDRQTKGRRQEHGTTGECMDPRRMRIRILVARKVCVGKALMTSEKGIKIRQKG